MTGVWHLSTFWSVTLNCQSLVCSSIFFTACSKLARWHNMVKYRLTCVIIEDHTNFKYESRKEIFCIHCYEITLLLTELHVILSHFLNCLQAYEKNIFKLGIQTSFNSQSLVNFAEFYATVDSKHLNYTLHFKPRASNTCKCFNASNSVHTL